VLINNGSNVYRSAGSSAWKAISIGQALRKNDELKTAQNAYLGLIHSSGRTLEFRKTGVYNITDLEEEIGIKKGLPSRYSEFVSNEFLYDDTQRRIAKTSRDINDIHVYLPESSEILTSTIIVDWEAPEESEFASYDLVIMNMFDELVEKIHTSTTSAVIDLELPSLSDEKLLVCQVKVAEDPDISSVKYGFMKISGEKKSELLKELDLLSTIIDENTPLGQILLAAFFEENKLLVDASYHFQQSMKMAPPESGIETLYEKFLSRNKLR
jgi:hypothetical protein